MKSITSILVLFLLFINSHLILAQSTECKVLLPELVGSYNGKCKKGIAHGNGVAEGKDKYDGRFKNGLPDGYGTYTYSNGSVYEGYFSEGKKHGNGKYRAIINGKDSSFNGVWKDDNFVKFIVPPSYKVNRSINVNRLTIQRVGEGKRVFFVFTQNGMTNSTISNLQMISEYGTYLELGAKKGYENLSFPVLFKVTFSTLNGTKTNSYEVFLELTINEPGEWLVNINN